MLHLCWNRKLVAPISYAPTSHVTYVWAANIWKPLALPARLVRSSFLAAPGWVGVGRCAHQLVLWAWEDLTLVASVVLDWQFSDGAPGRDNCLFRLTFTLCLIWIPANSELQNEGKAWDCEDSFKWHALNKWWVWKGLLLFYQYGSAWPKVTDRKRQLRKQWKISR